MARAATLEARSFEFMVFSFAFAAVPVVLGPVICHGPHK
jgi:hypothetical protein